MKPIRVAQIGTGHDHASSAFQTIRKLRDDFDVIGLAEPNPAHNDRLHWQVYADAPVYTVEQLLDMKPDAVLVETDEELATEYAQRFADGGAAVYMDKPGSADYARFMHLTETLESKGKAFQMGYMYRFNPEVRRALAAVRAGELGEIYAVEAQMSVHHSPEKRAWLGKYPGGMMYFLGCHLVDLVYQLQGEPDRVRVLNGATGAEGIDAPDYGFVALEYLHGVSFIKTCAREINGFDRRQLVICGTRGTIEIKPLEKHIGDGRLVTRTRTTRETAAADWFTTHDESEQHEYGPYDRYEEMLHTFAQIVRGERENEYSYEYERKLFRLVMRCCGQDPEGGWAK